MKCFYCKQESEWLQTKTNHIVDLEGRIIIIRNVPCQECPCCGEAFFTNEVSGKLDELFSKADLSMYDYAEMDYDDPLEQVYRLVKENPIVRVAESTHSYGNN